MNAADKLRNELNKESANIIATRFAPQKDAAMEIIAKGIKRLGYVEIDTLHCQGTGTPEGRSLSYLYGGLKSADLNTFAEFLKAEGFKVSKAWWGYSSNGNPDILKISL